MSCNKISKEDAILKEATVIDGEVIDSTFTNTTIDGSIELDEASKEVVVSTIGENLPNNIYDILTNEALKKVEAGEASFKDVVISGSFELEDSAKDSLKEELEEGFKKLIEEALKEALEKPHAYQVKAGSMKGDIAFDDDSLDSIVESLRNNFDKLFDELFEKSLKELKGVALTNTSFEGIELDEKAITSLANELKDKVTEQLLGFLANNLVLKGKELKDTKFTGSFSMDEALFKKIAKDFEDSLDDFMNQMLEHHYSCALEQLVQDVLGSGVVSELGATNKDGMLTVTITKVNPSTGKEEKETVEIDLGEASGKPIMTEQGVLVEAGKLDKDTEFVTDLDGLDKLAKEVKDLARQAGDTIGSVYDAERQVNETVAEVDEIIDFLKQLEECFDCDNKPHYDPWMFVGTNEHGEIIIEDPATFGQYSEGGEVSGVMPVDLPDIKKVIQWGEDLYKEPDTVYMVALPNVEEMPPEEPEWADGGVNMFKDNPHPGIGDIVAGWDLSRFKSTEGMFDGASVEFSRPFPAIPQVENASGMFSNAVNADPDFSLWVESPPEKLEKAFEMFKGATSFTGEGLSGVVMPALKDATAMFLGATALDSGVELLGSSGTLEITSRMFRNTGVSDIDLSAWKVGNVTDMSSMFSEAERFKGVGLEGWDVSSAKTMRFLFNKNHELEADLSQWDVSNCEIFSSMFQNASGFNQPIPRWDLSGVTGTASSVAFMFYGCSLLKQDFSKWCVEGISSVSRNVFEKSGMEDHPELHPVWGTCP